MILAVDIGNTETVLGLFEGRDVRVSWRLATEHRRTGDEIALLLRGLIDVEFGSESWAVERAVILSPGEMLEPGDLQLDYGTSTPRPEPESDPRPEQAEPTVLKLDQIEKATIEKALRKHGFNISSTAKELGLTRASLYRRMEKHGI